MDKETQYRLEKISKYIAKDAKNVVKSVPSEHYKMAMEIANNSRLSRETREAAMRTISSGTVKEYETVIDSKKQRELDARMESAIKKEVDAGNIKYAKDDNFQREMRERMK